jgi:hypothetical protein
MIRFPHAMRRRYNGSDQTYELTFDEVDAQVSCSNLRVWHSQYGSAVGAWRQNLCANCDWNTFRCRRPGQQFRGVVLEDSER